MHGEENMAVKPVINIEEMFENIVEKMEVIEGNALLCFERSKMEFMSEVGILLNENKEKILEKYMG